MVGGGLGPLDFIQLPSEVFTTLLHLGSQLKTRFAISHTLLHQRVIICYHGHRSECPRH